MRRIVPAFLLALAACSQPAAKAPTVEKAWVRLPAVPGRPGAGYFTLTGGLAPARLIAVESDKAAKVELHESGMDGGRMTMRRLDAVNVPPGAPVAFRPGGNHAMLFGILPEVKPGDVIPLSFRFEDGSRIVAQAKAVGAADPAPVD